MSKKADRLLERIVRMEDKLLSLKCEYNMLLCKEDHNGDLGAFAASMSNERTQYKNEDEPSADGLKEFVLVLPSHKAGAEHP